MPLPLLLLPAAVSLATGVLQTVNESNKARRERQRLKRVNQRMKEFQANRQPVLNQADEYRALKDQLSNPYANLGVATQAAEMQMEQTDQALANTLDTIRATGAGAGGATALAQAAAQSKAKVSANIQQQEAANQKAAAQGEANLQAQQLQLDKAALGAERQTWSAQEQRDIDQMNRMQSQIDNRQANLADYREGREDAILGTVGGVGTAMAGMDFTKL